MDYLGLLTEKSKYYSILTQINNMMRDVNIIDSKSCPYCQSGKLIKYGRIKSNNAQIFYCKDCKKRFVETIGTPFYRSKKDDKAWKKYFEHMWIGYNIRECAEMMDIGHVTAFFWRHKILKYYLKFFKRKKLDSEAEVQVKTYKQNSKKEKESAIESINSTVFNLKLGEKFYFFFTKDKDGNIEFLPFDKYPLVRRTLKENLSIVFSNMKKVAIQGNNVINAYAKKFVSKVERVPLNSELIFYTREMKEWLRGFWGISFRYIRNYFNWFRIYYINDQSYINTRQYYYKTFRELISEKQLV